MGRRRSSVRACLFPRGGGDATVRRRPNADLGQSVRTHWYEEDRNLSEMVPEKAAAKGMKERG
jgi:hypothetical protein